MGFFSGIRKVFSHIVDFRVDRWADVQSHKRTTHYFWILLKKLLKSPSSVESEAFEEAVLRQGLSPERLARQSAQYRVLALVFLGLSLLLLVYAIVLCCLANWMGLCITIALILYTLSLAFRFHFWHFQMSTQKLGCSLREWAEFLKQNLKQVYKHS